MITSVDLFAGGGGASEGIRRATGRAPFVAVNHDEHAIAMHAANHPSTVHLCESVFAVDPRRVVGRRRVDLLWASPDCTHFSRAKGGKPRSQKIRGLAWIVLEWASSVRPRVICVENVPEFLTWGPLDGKGRVLPDRKGETFRQWVGSLELLGYRVEWRKLVAADYGAPTTRKRLFIVARCDGAPIAWPEPTHGPGRSLPYRTAAECIDWSLPCPSIFERKRPLAEATQRRIAEGLRRYVLEVADPFIVRIGHQSSDSGKVKPVDEPLTTITSKNEHVLVVPSLMANNTNNQPRSPDEPLGTVTTGNRHYLVAPSVIHHRGASVGRRADQPLPTVTATGQGHLGLIAPTLIQMGYGERDGQRPRALNIEAALGTVVAGGSKHGLVTGFLAHHNTGSTGRDLRDPVSTVVAAGSTRGPVTAWLSKHYGGGPNGKLTPGQDLRSPAGTVTSRDSSGLSTASLGPGGDHAAAVAAFIIKYYGAGGQTQSLREPLHTIVSRARFGLVEVELGGERWVITDIGMRMLQPRELARAQGFADDYVLTGTKAQRIARIGNSVPPPVVEAIVRAQFGLAARVEAA